MLFFLPPCLGTGGCPIDSNAGSSRKFPDTFISSSVGCLTLCPISLLSHIRAICSCVCLLTKPKNSHESGNFVLVVSVVPGPNSDRSRVEPTGHRYEVWGPHSPRPCGTEPCGATQLSLVLLAAVSPASRTHPRPHPTDAPLF